MTGNEELSVFACQAHIARHRRELRRSIDASERQAIKNRLAYAQAALSRAVALRNMQNLQRVLSTETSNPKRSVLQDLADEEKARLQLLGEQACSGQPGWPRRR